MPNSTPDRRIATYNDRKLVSNNSMKSLLSRRDFGWPVNFLAKLSAAHQLTYTDFLTGSFRSRSPNLFCSFFRSSLTKWIYMHNLLNKLKILTISFSTFQLTPVSIKPELASQQQIKLRPFIVDLFQNIIFFIILFKYGLTLSIALAIALEAGSEQHIF